MKALVGVALVILSPVLGVLGAVALLLFIVLRLIVLAWRGDLRAG